MVERCNAVGVRIYVDAVINHMAGMDRQGRYSAAQHVADQGLLGHYPIPGFETIQLTCPRFEMVALWSNTNLFFLLLLV